MCIRDRCVCVCVCDKIYHSRVWRPDCACWRYRGSTVSAFISFLRSRTLQHHHHAQAKLSIIELLTSAIIMHINKHYFIQVIWPYLLHCCYFQQTFSFTTRVTLILTCQLCLTILCCLMMRWCSYNRSLFIFMVKTSQFTTKCKIDCWVIAIKQEKSK